MSIIIATLADKHPDFIKYQHYSIEKYVKGEWEHIVFNNAIEQKTRDDLNVVCNELKIGAIDITCNYTQHTSIIQGEAIDKAWREYLQHQNKPLLWIDIDMFFISKIKPDDFIDNYDIGYIPIYRENFGIECMWAGIIFLNTEKIDKNIEFGLKTINGIQTDTGGSTYFYLQRHPEYRRLYFASDTIFYSEGNTIKTSMNFCSPHLEFSYDNPDKLLDGKIFPHEKNNDNYWEKYKTRFEEHMEIIKKYSFPNPYHFDLIRKDDTETPFIFHYKSASWDSMYENGKNQYSADKRDALRRLLNI